jgi:LmbE family N-acetylglucosaminyl deacetylase
MGPGDRRASVAVDTTATVDRKVAALLCHKSQIPDPEGLTKRILEGAQAQAQLAGLPAGSSAELFRVISVP